jgi:peptidoglycan/xylan/chitin deacetylase (PgdA/CDA1 family)
VSSSNRPTATQIYARATVPVLCWHQLRDWESADSDYARTLLICPPAYFRAQLDALAEHGWNTINADQYLDHLTTGAALPDKPVMLSFDDSQGSQRTEGYPQLRKRGMTATFFVMTVVLDKPEWLSRADIREFAEHGMTIGAHTWDHHRVDRYHGKDWKIQLYRPRKMLEKLIGKPVVNFAYPYGAGNATVFRHLRAAGYRAAYQLEDRPLDPKNPLLTLRRQMVNSTWSGAELISHLEHMAETRRHRSQTT